MSIISHAQVTSLRGDHRRCRHWKRRIHSTLAYPLSFSSTSFSTQQPSWIYLADSCRILLLCLGSLVACLVVVLAGGGEEGIGGRHDWWEEEEDGSGSGRAVAAWIGRDQAPVFCPSSRRIWGYCGFFLKKKNPFYTIGIVDVVAVSVLIFLW